MLCEVNAHTRHAGHLLAGLDDSQVQLLALGIAELCALADGVSDDKGLVDYLQQLRARAGVSMFIYFPVRRIIFPVFHWP